MTKSKWLNYSSFSKNSVVAALDIGSSKICCLIAQSDKSGNISIIGAGFQESKGFISGVITDMNALENWTKFNPEKSAHIFDKSGFELGKDGFRRMPNGDQLELEIIVVSGWSDWIRSAQVVSQNLNKVGIKTKVIKHNITQSTPNNNTKY